LQDPEIELIVVNTPDKFHYEMTLEALKAGKHVVVEKPFTFKTSEADALISLAKDKNLLMTVFQNRRWDSDFMTVRQVIESGVLGKVVEFESHFDRYRPVVAENTWKEEGDEYAGVLYNLGSHMVDQALLLFGIPQGVTANLKNIRSLARVFDFYDLRLHYPGMNVALKCSYLVREEGPRYILHGEGGSFLKWGIDPQEEKLKKGILPEGNDWGKEEESFRGLLNTTFRGLDFNGRITTLKGDYPAFYKNLFDAIRNGKSLAVRPEEARDGIRVLEACLESHRLGKTVYL
jgi:predicted dehydrogenase